ncbi:MAG: pantoate--beta-alanine ligase [Thermodesulfobacteriota bacterium]
MTNRNIKKVTDACKMQLISNANIKKGLTISFVPTMGALHDGHLSLVKRACELGDITVVSIFVNPTQFGPKEDFNRYERDIEGDFKKLSSSNVNYVFCPDTKDIYPDGFQTYVEVSELQRPLCGLSRDGHFRGVTTVVLKLFNIVRPNIAIFGEKDYQQLKIIERMVLDLNLDIDIVGMPIYRENNGLAMSSRNAYLSENEKKCASFIHKSLTKIKDDFYKGLIATDKLIENAKIILFEGKIEDIEYLEIRNSTSLELKSIAATGDIAAVAVKINGIRLIDNLRI